jgi:hypothetical protein
MMGSGMRAAEVRLPLPAILDGAGNSSRRRLSVIFFATSNMVVADTTLRERVVRYGIRKLMRATGLHQHTIEAIRDGEPIRRATLKRVQTALNSSYA